MEVAQGDDGRRVFGDRRERSRRVGEHAADREVDHRRRNGRAAIGHECRRPDQLGESVQRQHVDGRDTTEPAERPAGHDPGGVGGDDHRDRGERPAGLGPAHGAGERGEGVAGRGGVDADRHMTDRRKGCADVPDRRSRCERFRWQRLRLPPRSVATAWPRPSSSRYRALPATRTFAPAAAAPAIVVGLIPPSTSTSTVSDEAGVVEHPPDLGDLAAPSSAGTPDRRTLGSRSSPGPGRRGRGRGRRPTPVSRG